MSTILTQSGACYSQTRRREYVPTLRTFVGEDGTSAYYSVLEEARRRDRTLGTVCKRWKCSWPGAWMPVPSLERTSNWEFSRILQRLRLISTIKLLVDQSPFFNGGFDLRSFFTALFLSSTATLGSALVSDHRGEYLVRGRAVCGNCHTP